jgi:hypothetical protein
MGTSKNLIATSKNLYAINYQERSSKMTSHEIRNKSPDSSYFPQFIDNPIAVSDHKLQKENIMKTPKRTSIISRIGFSVMLMLTALAVAPQYAAANTASNTAIINTVTVNYKDAGAVAQTPVTAYATVTVTLVAAAPTLSTPGDQNSTLGTPANFTYTVTSNANGPDTYTLSTSANGGSVTNSTHMLTSSAVPSVGSVTLGATTAISSIAIPLNTDTPITVPSDGVSGGGVNGISAAAGNNKVVINGLLYTVISVVDNPFIAGTPVTSTITVNGPAQAALTNGTLIAEQKTITLVVTPLTMNATITNETVTTVISAKGSFATAATDSTTTTVLPANLTVTKEVSTDGITWGATANAAPGAALYYRITVHNGGAANATVVSITDPLTSYTTYTAATAKRATGAAVSYAAAPTVLTDLVNAGDDGYDFTAGIVNYSVASIAPLVANDVQLFFKVTVK